MGWVTLERQRVAVFLELRRISELMMNLTRKKLDMHKYSASVSKGFMTPLAMAGMPASCSSLALGMALAQPLLNKKALDKASLIWGSHYGNASTGLSAADAAKDFGSTVWTMLEDPKTYEANLAKITDDAARNQEYMKHQYMLNIFQKAQEEERKEFAKAEAEKIKEIEDEIDLEMQQLNTRRDALKQDHDSLKGAVAAAQKEEAAKYGGGNG